jgi:hypothetical protein
LKAGNGRFAVFRVFGVVFEVGQVAAPDRLQRAEPPAAHDLPFEPVALRNETECGQVAGEPVGGEALAVAGAAPGGFLQRVQILDQLARLARLRPAGRGEDPTDIGKQGDRQVVGVVVGGGERERRLPGSFRPFPAGRLGDGEQRLPHVFGALVRTDREGEVAVVPLGDRLRRDRGPGGEQVAHAGRLLLGAAGAELRDPLRAQAPLQPDRDAAVERCRGQQLPDPGEHLRAVDGVVDDLPLPAGLLDAGHDSVRSKPSLRTPIRNARSECSPM